MLTKMAILQTLRVSRSAASADCAAYSRVSEAMNTRVELCTDWSLVCCSSWWSCGFWRHESLTIDAVVAAESDTIGSLQRHIELTWDRSHCRWQWTAVSLILAASVQQHRLSTVLLYSAFKSKSASHSGTTYCSRLLLIDPLTSKCHLMQHGLRKLSCIAADASAVGKWGARWCRQLITRSPQEQVITMTMMYTDCLMSSSHVCKTHATICASL